MDGCFQKCPPWGPTSYLSPYSRYFESKDFDLDLWPFKVIQSEARGQAVYNLRWVHYRNCCRSRHISRKKYDPDFWPLMVIQSQMWWCQSKARGSCSAPGVSTSHLSPFSRYFESKFWRWPLILWVIQSQIRWCQTWRRPAAGASPPSCKISAWSRKWSTRCVTKFFHFLTLGG